jgi:hypothetical protein
VPGAIARTTIYYWVRDLPIERRTRQNAGQRLGNPAMQEKYRKLREAAYADGLRRFESLSCDPLFRDFVALYIAEGSKRARNVVALCNSDPRSFASQTYGSVACPRSGASTASSTTLIRTSRSSARSGPPSLASIRPSFASSASPTVDGSPTGDGARSTAF